MTQKQMRDEQVVDRLADLDPRLTEDVMFLDPHCLSFVLVLFEYFNLTFGSQNQMKHCNKGQPSQQLDELQYRRIA